MLLISSWLMLIAEVKLKYRRCQTEISPYMQNVQGQMLHSVSKLFDSYHFFDDLWKICFHGFFFEGLYIWVSWVIKTQYHISFCVDKFHLTLIVMLIKNIFLHLFRLMFFVIDNDIQYLFVCLFLQTSYQVILRLKKKSGVFWTSSDKDVARH